MDECGNGWYRGELEFVGVVSLMCDGMLLFLCEVFAVCMEYCLSVGGCDGIVEGGRLGCLCRECVSVDVFFLVRVTLLEGWFRCSLFSVLVD